MLNYQRVKAMNINRDQLSMQLIAFARRSGVKAWVSERTRQEGWFLKDVLVTNNH